MKNSKLVAAMIAAALALSVAAVPAFAEDTVEGAKKTGVVTTGSDDETTTEDEETTADETTTEEEYTTGDVDGNGKVNSADIVKVAAHIKGIKALDEKGKKAADVDANKKINSADIVKIAAHIKGIKKFR